MPGIVGFTRIGEDHMSDNQILKQMQELITHHNDYVHDPLFVDDKVCATRAHINIIQQEEQPYNHNGIYIWLDGEFYNRGELIAGGEKYSDLEVLYRLYIDEQNYSFTNLKAIDGIYSAVIYDSHTNQVHLISDRYGLRHLYWIQDEDRIIWGSEGKVILAFSDIMPRIDTLAVQQFMNIGYVLEDRTLLQQVKLVPAATVLSWDLGTKVVTQRRYWWWDEIKPLYGKINEEEVIHYLGDLFMDAVRKRCFGHGVGLQLSGGLDSRAILAAIPDELKTVEVLTFGKEGCDDITYASIAATKKGLNHHIVELEEKNWLGPRISGVWWTDGMEDILHMHGIVAIEPRIKDKIKINLNGFLGDAVLGGSYIRSRALLDDPHDKQLISKFMGCDPTLLENHEQYKQLNKSDYYFLQNRGRRFIYEGTKLTLTGIEHRKPFYDNKLIEFVYSLPDHLRFNSYIYNKMLLHRYPTYFKTIPWQKTGLTINWPHSLAKLYSLARRGRNKIARESFRLGIDIKNQNEYTDYANWIRKDPARSFFQKLLNNKNSIIQNYWDAARIKAQLESHMSGNRNYDHLLTRYLTLEIWLQQVYENKYRPAITNDVVSQAN